MLRQTEKYVVSFKSFFNFLLLIFIYVEMLSALIQDFLDKK